MREVIAYRCEHCSYTKLTKSVIKKHETMCFWNPDTTSCATCFHRFCGEPFFCTIEHSEKQTTFCPAWANADDIDHDDRKGYLDAKSHLQGYPF